MMTKLTLPRDFSHFLLWLAFLWGVPMGTYGQFVAPEAAPLRVMSFNLRFNNPGDGPDAWPQRIPLVQGLIRYHQPDLIGIQEALPGQIEDLKAMFPDFVVYGIARDTASPEYAAILYRAHRFEVLDGGTFWLSETPARLSRGWDAALPRIVTWLKLRDRRTGQAFFHFNTHFDHVGQTARRESVKLIQRQLAALNPEGLPALLTGDFNFPPTDPNYALLADSTAAAPLRDAFHASRPAAYGPPSTWSGFRQAGEPGRRIDYVWLQHGVAALRHAILSESWSGRFPSDHLPVLAEVVLAPVQPLFRAHSHNDYAQAEPLHHALSHGMTHLEADLWLIDGELYVTHDRPKVLDPARTLRRLYLDPLARRAQALGGRLWAGSEQPLWLMLDLKNDGEAAYAALQQQLTPYAWLLRDSTGNPPLRIFLSGERPVATILAAEAPLVSLDGRPADLGQGIPAAKMPVVSTPYRSVLRWRGKGAIPAAQAEKVRALAAQVQAEGKRLRLWATPEDERVWTTLLELGVDLLNTDEPARLEAFLREK